jgi:membrane protease YdiL (CAAX protease family)
MDLAKNLYFLRRSFITFLFPAILIISNYIAVHFFTRISGTANGYLGGMIFYWLLWCILPVMLWTSKTNRRLLLKVKRLNWWQILLLIVPVVLVAGFQTMASPVQEVPAGIIVVSALPAIVNAICEEALWRGLFYDHHQANFFYAVIVPAIWYGIWYYVPLSIHPVPAGDFYYITGAVIAGCCWGIVTYTTRSVFWGIVSHFVADWIRLSAIYFIQ